MIKNKKDYYYFLEMDKKALGKKGKPKIIGDIVWKWEILLRRCEYYKNTNKKIRFKVYKYFFNRLSIKLGYTIPLNVFDYGLSIAHYGTIVVNGNSKIGKNCRIQEGVTIGATNGNESAPVIGDNVFIGSGAKIIGDIVIGDNTAVGAGAVVVKSFEDGNCTIGGVPAKKISNNSSSLNLLINHKERG